MSNYLLSVSPSVVSLEEAKAHMRINHELDDAYILTLLRAAQLKVEEDTRQSFPGAKYKLLTSGKTVDLNRTKSPTISAGFPKAGKDEDSLETVAAEDFTLLHRYAFPRVEFESGVDTTAVEIEYTTGTDEVILTLCRMCILQLCCHWYESREATAPVELRTVPNNYNDLVAMFSGIN
tara:strand:+ start:2237 stop:2770 length:534 start_codon:yes stop_codon:yes gene_type:complete